MSSFKMHLAISNKVMKELNLNEDFLLGSILPDILKLITKNRDITHFQNKQGLPDIDLFISKYEKTKTDLTYGYLAHLIEDYVWFDEYINKKYKDKYKSDEEIYSDYGIIDEYITSKENLDIKLIKEILKNSTRKYPKISGITNSEIENLIDEKIIEYSHDENIKFFQINDADEYFNKAYNQVKNIINKNMNW